MSFSRSVIISCAGMGNRLGLGTTKALIEISGKPLIVHYLEMLKNEEDVRIVIGYQAEKIIEVVKGYRPDALFVFNHHFRETNTGTSVSLASKYANEYILSLDGDLLVHPEDMIKILECKHEFIGGNPPESDDPWMLQTYSKDGQEYVSAFSKCMGNYEWNGVAQIQAIKMLKGTGHVFQLIEPYLPIPFMELRTKEIDTVNDYERALKWVQNGYK